MEKKTLESLVPPLDLCKQIPQGAFENSVLVWMGDLDGDPVLFPRECGICNQYGAEIAIAPAPTLAEIMEEIDQSFDANLIATFNLGQWVVEYRHYPKKGIGSDNFNPATAALRLWFDVKGRG